MKLISGTQQFFWFGFPQIHFIHPVRSVRHRKIHRI